MNIVDLIIKKRDGFKLTKEEIEFFIKGVSDDSLPDYQISAMLMAMLLRGMDDEETSILTLAMATSGDTFDLSPVKGIKVDKHSTGGVADTTTLVLAPLVASLGIPVVKMSGRGLGFSGGTLDKLESIPGFDISVSYEDAIKYANESNIVVMSQTANLTPADKKLYALRDVTGTVDSIPLIIGSIMSKKIAAGADAIVLDVKCGSGAFMQDIDSARKLAKGMQKIGESLGRKVIAVISSMDQPLGNYIGNALEVIEAIEVLKGNVKGDLLEVVLTLGSNMVVSAGKAETEEEAREMLLKNIENGEGIRKFRQFVLQQGGTDKIVDDYSLLPVSAVKKAVYANESGYIWSMDTAEIGKASIATGAGRVQKTDPLDLGAGIAMKVRLGDYIEKGGILAEVFAATEEKTEAAAKLISNAIVIKGEKNEPSKLILDIIK
ncbi:MAG: thymidine phosphorylase [Firmicutes bacterium]|nr:thymidine phosphorylase [Bacillota bacterium]